MLELNRRYTRQEAAQVIFSDFGPIVAEALGIENANYTCCLVFVSSLIRSGDIIELKGSIEGRDLSEVKEMLRVSSRVRTITQQYENQYVVNGIICRELKDYVFKVGPYRRVVLEKKDDFEARLSELYFRGIKEIEQRKGNPKPQETIEQRTERNLKIIQRCSEVLSDSIQRGKLSKKSHLLSAAYRATLRNIMKKNGFGDDYRRIVEDLF